MLLHIVHQPELDAQCDELESDASEQSFMDVFSTDDEDEPALVAPADDVGNTARAQQAGSIDPAVLFRKANKLFGRRLVEAIAQAQREANESLAEKLKDWRARATPHEDEDVHAQISKMQLQLNGCRLPTALWARTRPGGLGRVGVLAPQFRRSSVTVKGASGSPCTLGGRR